MIIPYSIQMKEEDRLYGNDAADPDRMEILHLHIINQASAQGFRGLAQTEIYDGEILSTVFADNIHRNDVHQGFAVVDNHAKCKDLMLALGHMHEHHTKYDLVYVVISENIEHWFKDYRDAVAYSHTCRDTHGQQDIEIVRAYCDINPNDKNNFDIIEIISKYKVDSKDAPVSSLTLNVTLEFQQPIVNTDYVTRQIGNMLRDRAEAMDLVAESENTHIESISIYAESPHNNKLK